MSTVLFSLAGFLAFTFFTFFVYSLGVVQGRKQATASLLWLFSQNQAAKIPTPVLPPAPAPTNDNEVSFQ